MGRLQVVLLSKAGEGPPDPLGGGTVLIMAPCGPRQKSQVGITVCSFVAGGASEAGSGLRAQWLLPAPQQASCLFALEIVLSQVTVKVVPGMMYCTVIGCFLTVVSGVGDVAVKGLQSVTVRNITVGMTHGLRSISRLSEHPSIEPLLFLIRRLKNIYNAKPPKRKWGIHSVHQDVAQKEICFCSIDRGIK